MIRAALVTAVTLVAAAPLTAAIAPAAIAPAAVAPAAPVAPEASDPPISVCGPLTWLAPGGDRPATGRLAVEVRLGAPAAGCTVVLAVDGGEIARLAAPPFRAVVELGDDLRGHRFTAVALGPDGSRVESERPTPALAVEAELRLDLQQLYVTVEGSPESGRPLRAEDFAILDDGVPQEVVTFSGGDAPLAALLLVDASASMAGERLEAARAGVAAFASSLRPLDEAAVLLFSDRPLVATPFGGRAEPLLDALDAARGAGGSAIHDHLYLGLSRLAERQGRRVAVLLSDGIDIDSALAMEPVRRLAHRHQIALYWLRPAERERRRISIYSAWRTPAEHAAARSLLARTVAESGGRVIDVAGPAAVPAAFAQVLAELARQVALGYYPSGNRDDGAWHRVEVRARLPGLVARTRDGYFDE